MPGRKPGDTPPGGLCYVCCGHWDGSLAAAERGKSLEGQPGEQAPSSSGEAGRKVESSGLSLENSESGSGLGRDSGGTGWKRWMPLGLLM